MEIKIEVMNNKELINTIKDEILRYLAWWTIKSASQNLHVLAS